MKTRSKTSLRFLGMFLVLASFSGCLKPEESDTRLINGRPIGADVLPAAVKITAKSGIYLQSCTATWVSDNAIVTAAHCVMDDSKTQILKPFVSFGEGKGIYAEKVLVEEGYRQRKISFEERDLAVIIFKSGSSSKYASVLDRDPVVGDDLEIVGFGKSEENNFQSGGFKATGTNKISSFNVPNGILRFVGAYNSTNGGTGVNVANSQGDSGGPAFVGGKIAGVSSYNDPKPSQGKVEGGYINLRDAMSMRFLKSALAQGARISGLDGSTPIGSGGSNTAPDLKKLMVKLDSVQKDGPRDFAIVKICAPRGTESLVVAGSVVPVERLNDQGGRTVFQAKVPVVNGVSELRMEARSSSGATLVNRNVKFMQK